MMYQNWNIFLPKKKKGWILIGLYRNKIQKITHCKRLRRKSEYIKTKDKNEFIKEDVTVYRVDQKFFDVKPGGMRHP